jgi:urease accessory protein
MQSRAFALLAALLFAPLAAHAHAGAGPAHGLADGFSHPLHGLDHLLAMIAVGLWAAQLGGRAIWAVPASFVGVMMLGGALGLSGATLPFVEGAILASVFLLGLLIVFSARPPLWAGAALVGAFALFHGHAHGAEMPENAVGALYAAGFVAATALLHLAGIGLGLALAKWRYAPAIRIAGAAVILGGALIALS